MFSSIKSTPYFVRLGYSTTIADNLICPKCKRHVRGLHRPFKYDSLEVCVFCFDDVKTNNVETKTNMNE